MGRAPGRAFELLDSRAARGSRDGAGSVNQSMNTKEAKAQQCAKADNSYYDQNMVLRRVTTVQQAADQTLFCRGNRWVDARLLKDEDSKPDREIEFGSKEHIELACRLAEEDGGNAGGRAALL